jgi:hypothetical protein
MSKGSRPRPFSVPLAELDKRHEAIFGVKPPKERYVPPPLPDDIKDNRDGIQQQGD